MDRSPFDDADACEINMIRSAVCIVAICAAVAPSLARGEGEVEDGFIQLFNGTDLSGWIVPEGDGGHWKVVDGVIDYDARSEAKGSKNLQTEQEFGDFILKIDWRLKKTEGLYNVPIVLTRRKLFDRRDRKEDHYQNPQRRFGDFSARSFQSAAKHLVLAGGLRRSLRNP